MSSPSTQRLSLPLDSLSPWHTPQWYIPRMLEMPNEHRTEYSIRKRGSEELINCNLSLAVTDQFALDTLWYVKGQGLRVTASRDIMWKQQNARCKGERSFWISFEGQSGMFAYAHPTHLEISLVVSILFIWFSSHFSAGRSKNYTVMELMSKFYLVINLAVQHPPPKL